MQDWFNITTKIQWKQISELRHAIEVIQFASKNKTKQLFQLNRRKLKIMSGHANFSKNICSI